MPHQSPPLQHTQQQMRTGEEGRGGMRQGLDSTAIAVPLQSSERSEGRTARRSERERLRPASG